MSKKRPLAPTQGPQPYLNEAAAEGIFSMGRLPGSEESKWSARVNVMILGASSEGFRAKQRAGGGATGRMTALLLVGAL